MGIFLSYLLIIPYVTVIIYFFLYKKDNFFLKIRSSVQLLLILMLLGISFIEILLWKGIFNDYTFFKFDIENSKQHFKTGSLVTILAAIAAVFGWIFTSRVQIINTTRSHSVQVLMNSRNSTIYIDKVDKATKIRRNLVEKRQQKAKKPNVLGKAIYFMGISKSPDLVVINQSEKIQLTSDEFKELEHDEKSSVTYLLNFLEFVAIGIRHNNLDEDLIKGSFKSILKSNYILFEPVIEFLRIQDSPKTYMQLEMLHKRWDEENELKCGECKKWYRVGRDNSKKNKYLKFFIHIVLIILTCGLWLAMQGIMKFIDFITKHKESNKFTCIDCDKDQKTTLEPT